ncbi:MAG: hypothetical protein WAV10_01370 [Minisyncoccia bacterium]
MEPSNYFFLIFLLTIVLTRIWLFVKPISSPTIKGFRLHHYMYGLVIVAISFFISNITLYAIGLGLFIDELIFLIPNPTKPFAYKEYISIKGILGTIILIIAVYFLRNYILLILS